MDGAKRKMISIGIDQSYTRIGIAIVESPGKLVSYNSYNYKGLKKKSEKRAFVKKLVKYAVKKYKPDVIVVERIRTFSQGIISTGYIKSTGALIATIVDAVFPNHEVFSADTRSWKARICGGSSGMHHADKGVSVRFVRKRFNIETNDDEADAICIALYGLSFKKLCKKEE